MDALWSLRLEGARWIDAARALESLPLLSQAFASGEIGIDKVVELTRFATPETESALLSWAQEVSCGAIRRRGDLHAQSLRAALDAERSRSLSWWYFDEGRRFGLEAELPASQGAAVARALERIAESLPATRGEDDLSSDARRADALVALASARIASDPDPDRATVVIHASLEAPPLDKVEARSRAEGWFMLRPSDAWDARPGCR